MPCIHSPVIRDKDIGQLDLRSLSPVGVVYRSVWRVVADSFCNSSHSMEFNCSQYEFDSGPPNVSQHLDGIKLESLLFYHLIIIYSFDSIGSRRHRSGIWRDGQFWFAYPFVPHHLVYQYKEMPVGVATPSRMAK